MAPHLNFLKRLENYWNSETFLAFPRFPLKDFEYLFDLISLDLLGIQFKEVVGLIYKKPLKTF